MKLDLAKIDGLLRDLAACDEKIADRGPIKVLPRPDSEIPNVPVLQTRIKELKQSLQVRRKTTTPKGHDLDNNGSPFPRDFKAVGTIEDVQTIAKGQDRALPKTTVIVRVHFPDGAHLWFDPDDLVMVEPKKAP